jgi:hypothetical protein
VNGADVEPLEALLAALEDPAIPAASLRWVNRHEAVIDAIARPDDVVFLQLSHDPGWHVFDSNGREYPVVRDRLGMMYVKPGVDGPVRLQLIYQGGPWSGGWGQWMLVAAGIGLALMPAVIAYRRG